MREQAGGGQSGPSKPLNSHGASPPSPSGGPGSGSHEQSETVRYINMEENPDYDIPEDYQ